MVEADHRRYVFVGPFFPYRGGIAHFAGRLHRALAGRGHALATVTFSRQYPAWLFPGKTQVEPATTTSVAQALRMLDTANPVSWFRAGWHVARTKPDAVIFQHWMSFFSPVFGIVARIVRKRGVRVIVVVHNVTGHERHRGARLLSRWFLAAADGCIVLSDAVKKELQELGFKKPVYQVCHGIYDHFGTAMTREDARRRLGLPPGEPLLLFFGIVRTYKGLRVLLESLPMVLHSLPGIHLMVAGEFYEDMEPTRALISRLGLEETVHLHAHYIPSEEVPAYFSATDVVVQPYVTATQSGVAHIAFHYDKPLIVTDVGGLAETVPHEKAGLVVPPEDPEALAAAIVRFFEEDMACSLREGVRQEKLKYSWDRICEAVESLSCL